MGGCYDSSYSYSSSRCSTPSWKTTMEDAMSSFFRKKDLGDLVKAHVAFFESNTGGFIKQLLAYQNIAEADKEFPEIEYEVKLNIVPVAPKAGAKEPGIGQYLDAFEFPAVQRARFLKDPINTNAEGINHFFGDGENELLVVIEKGGKLYLKEKSQPLQLDTGVPYEQVVMKRTESRYEATMDKIMQKVSDVNLSGGKYVGAIRKEKGDAFILDAHDGRIFSFTVTRAALQVPCGEPKVQRQLEIEYAGYVPGFPDFLKGDERQIVSDMVDLAKHVAFLSNNAPVANGWRMEICPTSERKYDFVRQPGDGQQQKLLTGNSLFGLLPETSSAEKKKVKK